MIDAIITAIVVKITTYIYIMKLIDKLLFV